MEQYLTKAEQLCKDQRYEEALAAYEEALRLSLPDPDPRIYYGRATVLEQLAERAYEMAKQGRKREDEQEEINLRTINLTDLARYATEEIAKSRRMEVWNEQYSLEILRRAVLFQDSEPWEVLLQVFSETVLVWLSAHPRGQNALQFDSADHYVVQTFARCWDAMRKSQVVFPSLDAFLKYLRVSLNAVIVDTLRASSKSLPALDEFDEPIIETTNQVNELWEVIQAFIPDPKEKRVAYLILYCGLKPREITQYFPDEFKDAKDISRLYRKILNRITRDGEQIRWKLSSRKS